MQPQSVLQEVFFQIQAGRGFALQQDQRKSGNLLQRIGVVEVAGIISAGDKDGMGGKAGKHIQGPGITGCAGKGHIHLAGLQQAQNLMTAAGNDLDMDRGVLSMEGVQIGEQKLAGDRVAGADNQLSHLQFTGLGELCLAGFQQPHGAAHIFV